MSRKVEPASPYLQATGPTKASTLAAFNVAVRKDSALPQNGSLQAQAATGAAAFPEVPVAPATGYYVKCSAGVTEVGAVQP